MFITLIAVGRLGGDPELRYTADGRAMVRLRLAVDQPPRDGERETLWLTVLAFGKPAERVNEIGAKGRLVLVQGRLRERRWTDSSGTTRSAVEVLADRIRFLDRPPAPAAEAEEREEPAEERTPEEQEQEEAFWWE